MQWFEYDKAEEMLEAIQNNIESLENDISIYGEDLSRSSLIAIKNEVGRLTMHKEDIEELLVDEETS
jgi:phosphopantetheine adenylyltransferase